MKTTGLACALVAAIGLLLVACTEQTWVKIDVGGGDAQQEVVGDVADVADADAYLPDVQKDHSDGDLDVVQLEAETPYVEVPDWGDADLPDGNVQPDTAPEIVTEVPPDTEIVTPPIRRQIGWFGGCVSAASGDGAMQVINGFGFNGHALVSP
jgi:hypothetical protein